MNGDHCRALRGLSGGLRSSNLRSDPALSCGKLRLYRPPLPLIHQLGHYMLRELLSSNVLRDFQLIGPRLVTQQIVLALPALRLAALPQHPSDDLVHSSERNLGQTEGSPH